MCLLEENKLRFYIIVGQAHDKTYNKTCATSEDSDQPAHPRRLIWVFADPMCLLQHPGYPKRDRRELLSYCVEVDLSLCWSHRSYCRFCRALAHMYLFESQHAKMSPLLCANKEAQTSLRFRAFWSGPPPFVDISSTVLNDSVDGQRKSWWDYVAAQADQDFSVLIRRFSRDAHHFYRQAVRVVK